MRVYIRGVHVCFYVKTFGTFLLFVSNYLPPEMLYAERTGLNQGFKTVYVLQYAVLARRSDRPWYMADRARPRTPFFADDTALAS